MKKVCSTKIPFRDFFSKPKKKKLKGRRVSYWKLELMIKEHEYLVLDNKNGDCSLRVLDLT